MNELYIPNICYDRIAYDVTTFLHSRIPPDDIIYRTLGVPLNLQGGGLGIVPDPSMGGKPRCSMSMLLHLALVSSPRKCLLGYEIIAMLKGYFRYYQRQPSDDWQVC